MGQHRALDRGFGPGDGGGVLSVGVGGHGDFVMLADAAALFFQPPDALLDIGHLLLGAWLVQAGGELGQTGLEAGDEASGDLGFLGVTAGGMTIKPDFGAIFVQHALQLDRLVRRGQRIDRLIRIELAGTFAADHEVAIVLRFNPSLTPF